MTAANDVQRAVQVCTHSEVQVMCSNSFASQHLLGLPMTISMMLCCAWQLPMLSHVSTLMLFPGDRLTHGCHGLLTTSITCRASREPCFVLQAEREAALLAQELQEARDQLQTLHQRHAEQQQLLERQQQQQQQQPEQAQLTQQQHQQQQPQMGRAAERIRARKGNDDSLDLDLPQPADAQEAALLASVAESRQWRVSPPFNFLNELQAGCVGQRGTSLCSAGWYSKSIQRGRVTSVAGELPFWSSEGQDKTRQGITSVPASLAD